MATGAGFDDLTVWGTSKAGHGAKDGAWFINYRIPFQKSVRVTLQVLPPPRHDQPPPPPPPPPPTPPPLSSSTSALSAVDTTPPAAECTPA